MGSSKQCEPCRTICIRGISTPVGNDVKHIAQRKGITKNAFMIQALEEIANSFPDHMKTEQQKTLSKDRDYLQPRGLKALVRQQLENVATYMGVETSTLIKVKLAELLAAIPPQMKLAMED